MRGHLERYLLDLGEASFPTDAENLVPNVPACASCPKRTGNQRGLFADVTGDRCTDPACFETKRRAQLERTREAAIAEGRTVIEGKRAKALLPYEGAAPKDYVLLDSRCYADPKQRSYRTLLGKANTATSTLVETERGFVEVFPAEQAAKILHQRGIQTTKTSVAVSPGRAQERAQERRAKAERAYRTRLHEEIRKRAGKLDFRETLPYLAAGYYHETYGEILDRLARLRGEADRLSPEAIRRMSAAEAFSLMVDLALVPQTRVSASYAPPCETLTAFAKALGVDTKALRAELAGEAAPAKEKPRTARSTSKKSAKRAA